MSRALGIRDIQVKNTLIGVTSCLEGKLMVYGIIRSNKTQFQVGKLLKFQQLELTRYGI